MGMVMEVPVNGPTLPASPLSPLSPSSFSTMRFHFLHVNKEKKGTKRRRTKGRIEKKRGRRKIWVWRGRKGQRIGKEKSKEKEEGNKEGEEIKMKMWKEEGNKEMVRRE